MKRLFVEIVLFALILLLAVGIWTVHQLNWIRERREYAALHPDNTPRVKQSYSLTGTIPWSLRLFGEKQRYSYEIVLSDFDRIKALYPEDFEQ